MNSEQGVGPRQAHRRALVLIVEDDPGQRIDCRELLEDAGFAVMEAGDGRKALRSLADENEPLPALILLDLSMPFMDGWSFIDTLRSQRRLRSIPVVLVSAYDADAQVQSLVATHLKKPIDPAQLVNTVTALVAGRATADEPPADPASAAGRG